MQTAFPKPPFEAQPQPSPGSSSAMRPQPDYGEDSYAGTDRLKDKKVLLTAAIPGSGAMDRIDSDVLPLTQEFLSKCGSLRAPSGSAAAQAGRLASLGGLVARGLGVRRTTVTLVARQLEQAGAIQNRRDRIVVVDRQRLEDIACECYAIVRDQISAALPEIAH